MDTKYSEIDLVSLITAQTSRRSYRDYISYGILTLSADKDMMLARESGPMQLQARIISHQLGSTLQSTSLASRTTLLMTSSFRLYPSPLSVVHSNVSLVLLLITAPFRQITLMSSPTRQGSPSRHTIPNLLSSRSGVSL